MLMGYIRVSRDHQITALQEDAIKKLGCERTFIDKISGAKFDRPQLTQMLDFARPGDVVAVWRLDRLGRSLKDLIEIVRTMDARGIQLKSCKENIDTTTPTGKLMFHIFGAIAEFERDLIRERTMAGLEAARARGRIGGRKPATWYIKPSQIARAKELYAAKELKIEEIMKLTGFNTKPTFYKYVVHDGR